MSVYSSQHFCLMPEDPYPAVLVEKHPTLPGRYALVLKARPGDATVCFSGTMDQLLQLLGFAVHELQVAAREGGTECSR
jgi:hypothetical protein